MGVGAMNISQDLLQAENRTTGIVLTIVLMRRLRGAIAGFGSQN
jgi:hypothetical protein